MLLVPFWYGLDHVILVQICIGRYVEVIIWVSLWFVEICMEYFELEVVICPTSWLILYICFVTSFGTCVSMWVLLDHSWDDVFWFPFSLEVDESKYFRCRLVILCNIAYSVLADPWLGFQCCISYIRYAERWVEYGWEVNYVRSVCKWFASRTEFVVMWKSVWEELWSWCIISDRVLW